MPEPIKQGERYRCAEASCGCEIEVVKGCENCQCDNPQAPQCCCGKPMVKV